MTEDETYKIPSLKEQGYLPLRYMMVFLLFFGNMLNYILRINLNLAVITMVKGINTTENGNETKPIINVCGFEPSDEAQEDYDGEFDWDEWTQGLILGSMYWTYTLGQIPGGRISDMYGTRLAYGIPMLLSGLTTLLVPITANYNYIALIVVRMTMGLFMMIVPYGLWHTWIYHSTSESPTLPSAQTFLTHWAPLQERSFMLTLMTTNVFSIDLMAEPFFTGFNLGNIIGYPITAATIQALNWEAVFYTQGVVAIVWSVLWLWLSIGDPNESKSISQAELNYINANLNFKDDTNKKISIPWMDVLKSVPLWALFMAAFSFNWMYYTLLTDLPLYMKSMLFMDINSNALLTGLPYIGTSIYSFIISISADTFLRKKLATPTNVRKIFNTVSLMGPALCLLVLQLFECDITGTLTIFVLALVVNGGSEAGCGVNATDLAPNFAGTVYAIVNIWGSLPAFIAPMLVGAIVNKNQSLERWRIVFYLTAAISIVCSIVYIMFGSAEAQPWNQGRQAIKGNTGNAVNELDQQNQRGEEETRNKKEKKGSAPEGISNDVDIHDEYDAYVLQSFSGAKGN